MQPLLASVPASLPPYLTGFIEIDTQAIARNYRTLHAMLPQSTCAAVLKADAYGFGAKTIAPFLMHEGCRAFFVAHLEEGLSLRTVLKKPFIYVLSGFLPNTADFFVENALIPILNDFEMLKSWAKEAQNRKRKLSCALHIDTGMRRSGFDQKDLAKLLDSLDLLTGLDIHFVMSHLVSSQDNTHPYNEQQKTLFDSLRQHFPMTKASLADTGGIYLGESYHYDLVRPGKGIFGLFAPPKDSPVLQPCVKLLGRILQIRTAYTGESIGYGATYTLTRESKLATLGVGFADGYDRRFSNHSYVEIQGFKAPVVGNISMDYTVVDVTNIPESLCHVGGWAEFANESLTLDKLAHSIGTISRELSTGFGQRLYRVYC
ncbi:MAG: alanine racemase [Alphaproteobacteria bacterium]|nr:alanine racemase [Alphaproteobacteria bacterium]